MISQENLIVGCIYEVVAINFNVAIWTGKVFRGPKTEYGSLKFTEEYGYWEPLPLGTCKPIRLLSNHKLTPPFDGINLLKSLEALDSTIEGITKT